MVYTQQISVFLENRPGTLAELTGVLCDHNVDMRAMCVADAMDFGIARIIVDDVYNTMTVLKDAGYVCQITKVLTIEMQDEPGALSKILDLLGKEGINLEYTYTFLTRKKDTAYLVLKVADLEKAEKVLRAASVKLVGQESLQGIFGD
jgi:hypothetical protein